MCLGDSITLGIDATASWPAKNGFRYRLWYFLRKAGVPAQMVGPFSDGGTYAAWNANHAGIGGTTLATMNTNVAAWIATHTPDVVLILGGINDLVTQTVATTGTRLETLIDTIQATPTNPLIIVSTTTIHTTYLTKSNDYNALIPGICTAKSVAFVDSASDISAANKQLSDAVHPSARGYEKMAPRLATAIQTLLGL
jgi:lysophospholipase L1-like esterase